MKYQRLDKQERATFRLHAVEGKSAAEIAVRQGVSESVVYRTLSSCRTKLGAKNNAQAALRAYLSGELADADRTTLRRAANGIGEDEALEVERREQRKYFGWRGIGRDWNARSGALDDDEDDPPAYTD